jgi:hypothetical protein
VKRYLLFAGSTYYPDGGAEDFVGDFDSIERSEFKAFEHDKNTDRRLDWWHVFDTQEKKICLQGGFLRPIDPDAPVAITVWDRMTW